MAAPFIHLRVHSDYSLSQGTSKVADLVKRVASLDQPAMALTDVLNLHAALETTKHTAKYGVQPITGTQVNIVTNAAKKQFGSVILLAQNARGYINICKLVDMCLARGRTPENTLDEAALKAIYMSLTTEQPLTEGVIAITGVGAGGVFDAVFGAGGNEDELNKLVQRTANMLEALFPKRLYLEICRNGYPTAAETSREQKLVDLAVRKNIPIVGTTDVWYADESRHDAWEILRAVSKAKGAAAQLDIDDKGVQSKSRRRYGLRPSEEMRELFSDIPEAYDNTLAIAKRCAFQPSKRNPILPPFDTGAGRTEAEELRIQAREGLVQRLDQVRAPESAHQEYFDRLDYELGIIERMGFPGYFLIVSDFIKFAKSNGIPVGPGRGSGAGSVVAWALTITDLDPLRFGLLFERFLNPDRVSMPDFDIDFCQDRREEVIQYVKRKYGSSKVAMIATFMVIKSKTAIRDVARVANTPSGALPNMAVNEIASLIPPSKDAPAEPAKLADAYAMSEPFRQKIDDQMYPANRIVYDNALKVEGLYRNSSSHAAGVIIAGDDLTNLVPVGYDASADMTQVQFNMKDAEAAGLVKFDFLGLKTLSVIREAVENIKNTTGEIIDLSVLPYDDAETYAMLAEGRSNGVFQLESDGMKKVLRDIKPTQIEDLIAVVSLYRPGPMEMIPTYARRKNGLEQPEYPEPADQTSRFLGETYGIMVYQEQVMQVAQVVAGYSLGGADLLRRAMGKKIKSEMDAQKEQFIEGAQKNGTSAQKASELFDLIEKFSGYGFNKSHAAAYAVIAYHTAWLKRHYPAQFFAALMTYETGKPEKMGLVKQDMDQDGIPLLPPDVNASYTRFRPEQQADGKWAVRLGLTAIKGVTENVAGMIDARNKGGLFQSLQDFHSRAGSSFSSSQFQKMAEAGAFDSITPGGVRNRAFAILSFLTKGASKDKTESLFGYEDAPIVIPENLLQTGEWENRDDREFNAVGFFFREHPLDRRLGHLQRVGGVRERAKVVQYMEDNKKSDLQVIKLLGMVEFIENGTWNDGRKKLSFRVAERKETYFVGMSSPSKMVQSLDEVINILEASKKARIPLVFICDFVTNDKGIRIYCREVLTAENYLHRLQVPCVFKIEADPSRIKLSREDHLATEEIIAAIEANPQARSTLMSQYVEIVRPYLKLLHDRIIDSLRDYRTDDENGQSFVLQTNLSANPRTPKLIHNLDGRYHAPHDVIKQIGEINGVVSVREIDPEPQQSAAA